MLSYNLSQEHKHQLHRLGQKITQCYADVKAYSTEARAAMHRYARISMVGASTRIENALLTDTEIDWIDTVLTEDGKVSAFQAKKLMIENKFSKDRERSIEEVAGCRNMLQLIYDQAASMFPITETQVRGLHHELMRFYGKAKPHQGRYKVQSNSVIEHNHGTGKKRVVFQTADAGTVTKIAMEELINWYNDALPSEPYSLTVACEFVYRFLAIHPFQDGNGRLGRGLFLLVLLQCHEEALSYLAPYLAIDRQIEKNKSNYYYVLDRCSNGKFQQDPKKYHIELFLEFMIKILYASLEDITVYTKKYNRLQTLSESAYKVLACFKEHPEIRLTPKLIAEFTQLPPRTITYALTTLVHDEFIQRLGKGAGVRYQLVF